VLTVRSEPPGGAIYLDGQDTGSATPYSFDAVEPGTHTLEIRLPMYHPHRQQVELRPDDVLTLRPIPLKPAFGALRLESIPAGAEVVVDGNSLGVTPLVRERFASGEHRLELRAPLYRVTKEAFSVVDGQVFAKTYDLRPAFGRIRVGTQPAGALVSLDGEEVGRTPTVLEQVPSGPHTLTITHPFHRSRTEQLQVSDGVDMDRAGITLLPYHGTLAVMAGQVPARVLLDGQEVGPAPMEARKVDPGVHEVEVLPEDPRYRPHRETVTLDNLMAATVRPNLTARLGNVILTTHPPGAVLQVDGRAVGPTPQKLSGLLVGTHEVRAELAGHTPAEATVLVAEGETARLRLELPTRGALLVQSGLSGVRVLVDGADRGTAPVRLADLDDRTYQVRCELDAHLPAQVGAAVRRGHEEVVDCDLLPRDLVAEARTSKALFGTSSLVVAAGLVGGAGWVLGSALPAANADLDAAYAHYEAARTADLAEQYHVEVEDGLARTRTLAVLGWSLAAAGALAVGFGTYELVTMPSLDPGAQTVSVGGRF